MYPSTVRGAEFFGAKEVSFIKFRFYFETFDIVNLWHSFNVFRCCALKLHGFDLESLNQSIPLYLVNVPLGSLPANEKKAIPMLITPERVK